MYTSQGRMPSRDCQYRYGGGAPRSRRAVQVSASKVSAVPGTRSSTARRTPFGRLGLAGGGSQFSGRAAAPGPYGQAECSVRSARKIREAR